jgi:hypothetical protein
MSAPSPPPDNSMAVEQMRQQAAKEAQQAADAKEAAHKQELGGLRSTARQGASGSVNDYFSSRGIDPTRYGGSIESQLNNILSGISQTDENPGAAFQGAGQSIYDTLQTGERTKYGDQLNHMFAPNFETTRVPFTMDDPYLSGVEAEQYSDADSIVKNMLDRGVLTSSGATAARSDLENQRAGVRSRLNEVGTGLLSGEQQKLRDIANNARQTAGSLQLGSDFDPYSYSAQADQSFNDFLGGLGDQIRAQLPGKLFNTAGLAAIGGAGQGAGNTAYNPSAASGVIEGQDDTDTSKANQSNPNSIF